MAITWKNVNRTGGGAGASLVNQGIRNLSNAAQGFVDMAERQRRNNIGLNEDASRQNTDILLDRVNSLGGIDEYNAARDAGTFDGAALREATGGLYDSSVVRDAFLNRDNTIRREETEQYNYDVMNLERADRDGNIGFNEQILAANSVGALDSIQQSIVDSDLNDKTSVLTALNNRRDAMIAAQQRSALQGIQLRNAKRQEQQQLNNAEFNKGLADLMQQRVGNMQRTQDAQGQVASAYSDVVENLNGQYREIEQGSDGYFAMVTAIRRGVVDDFKARGIALSQQALDEETQQRITDRKAEYREQFDQVNFLNSNETIQRDLLTLAQNTEVDPRLVNEAMSAFTQTTSAFTELNANEKGQVASAMAPIVEGNRIAKEELQRGYETFVAENPVSLVPTPEEANYPASQAIGELSQQLPETAWDSDEGEMGKEVIPKLREFVNEGYGSSKADIPGWIVKQAIDSNPKFDDAFIYGNEDPRFDFTTFKSEVNRLMKEYQQSLANRTAISKAKTKLDEQIATMDSEQLGKQSEITNRIRRRIGKVASPSRRL